MLLAIHSESISCEVLPLCDDELFSLFTSHKESCSIALCWKFFCFWAENPLQKRISHKSDICCLLQLNDSLMTHLLISSFTVLCSFQFNINHFAFHFATMFFVSTPTLKSTGCFSSSTSTHDPKFDKTQNLRDHLHSAAVANSGIEGFLSSQGHQHLDSHWAINTWELAFIIEWAFHHDGQQWPIWSVCSSCCFLVLELREFQLSRTIMTMTSIPERLRIKRSYSETKRLQPLMRWWLQEQRYYFGCWCDGKIWMSQLSRQLTPEEPVGRFTGMHGQAMRLSATKPATETVVFLTEPSWSLRIVHTNVSCNG